MCMTSTGQQWPCRFYNNGCEVDMINNPNRSSVDDLHIAVIGPYSGNIGDIMTSAEPLLAIAAQEIEDSGILPGYRIHAHLADSGCSEAGGTLAAIDSLIRGPKKHAILGDCCSQSCAAINDAMQLFNVLQISPGCDSPSLSDRARFPYFTRMSPSDRYKVIAIYEIMKMLDFHRVSTISGPIYTEGAKSFFHELIKRDLDNGTYPWTILSDASIGFGSPEDYVMVADTLKKRDSRINMMALPEFVGVPLLCQFYLRGLLPPDYVWFVAAFDNWIPNITASFAGSPGCNCTAEQLHAVSYGLIVSGRGPIQSTNDVHGLSGRRLSDLSEQYNTECQSFGGGQGSCNALWSGYFYDGLWHFAAILHAYLVEQNHSIADLGTPSSRLALYELSLRQDYMGLTGPVRQFNSIEPTTTPPSFGDRDGLMLLRQMSGPIGNEFVEVARRTSAATAWLADLRWSPVDSTKMIACSGVTCDLDSDSAWIPRDRIEQCPAGSVFSIELGCVACTPGKYANTNMTECSSCGIGTFANETGQGECTPCSPGSFNNVLSAESCELCGQGFFANTSGASLCRKCDFDTYAAEKGLMSCSACPAGTTTAFTGAVDEEACQCKGELWDGECVVCTGDTRFEDGRCISCSRGLICDGSKEPMLAEGYWAATDNRFSVYQCVPYEFCPGGLPGQCNGGRIGTPCANCPPGQSWQTEVCADCTPFSVAGWLVAGLAAAIGIPAAYYFMNTKQTSKATTMLATSCGVGMTINMLQSIGIIGFISFSWPPALQWLFNLMGIFTLDLQAIGFDCVSSNPVLGYVSITSALPAALTWLLVFSFLSKLLPNKFRVEASKMLSTMGQFFQVSFTIYSKIALSPMMCYTHPNGKSGLLENNGIFCFESPEHTRMFIAGLCTIALLASFYSTALWATIRAPKYAAAGNASFMAATRFLLFRFRTDSWWFGTFMLPRGLCLSMSIVLAADNPYIQMILIISVILTYMLVQLITWPWKLPALNAFDAIVSSAMLMMMAILGAFAPELDDALKEQLTEFVIGIVMFLNCVVVIMLCVAAFGLVRLNTMGGSNENWLLALGAIPSPRLLSQKLLLLANKLKERIGTS
ncbi:GABBR2 [Symbiodinium sp. CCMP2592]|nr:GABBR2 [Symbiodinium sp. CCMP2592]